MGHDGAGADAEVVAAGAAAVGHGLAAADGLDVPGATAGAAWAVAPALLDELGGGGGFVGEAFEEFDQADARTVRTAGGAHGAGISSAVS